MHFPAQLQQRAAQFVTQNASGILTAGGVVGVGVTAVLTARASFKAAGIMREMVAKKRAKIEEEQHQDEFVLISDLTKTEIIKEVWPVYVLPVMVGVSTIVCVVTANRMSAKRAAALAAAYSLSESRLQEYKDKVQDKLGFTKERNIRDEIAQDKVNKNPPDKQVLILGSGDVLCYDSLSGRYFHSSVEIVKRAENKIHQQLFQSQSASLSDFYEEIGLERTNFSDMVGWNTLEDSLFEIRFSTTQSPDNRPCLVLEYSIMPKPDYHKLF